MAHPHRGLAGRSPSASSTARCVGWQEQYRDGIAALGARLLPTCRPDEQDRRLDARPRVQGAAATRTRARARTARPSTAATATSRAGAAIQFAGDVQPRGYTDEEVSGRA